MDLVGRTLSHYLLEAPIGAGGMGVVYRGRDLALGRLAAVKVLPPGFSPPLRQRLRLEAEGCARLQHPAIATFYESGEVDDVFFLAMELVDGETLRRRLMRGPLAANEAMSMAASLLEALGHAHAAGILHRDIKPDNIMLARDGRTRLLDFGLAREIAIGDRGGDDATREQTRLTGHGVVVGTVGYMSPEQIRGDPLDAGSDLYAVGLVLYEALAGRPAFEGPTAARLTAALHQDAPPLSRADIPAGLQQVITRALCREPSGRYGSAAAFLSDLRAVASGDVAPPVIEKMVVFDLQALRPEGEDTWIGSAVADSLTADLSRAPRLQVVGREKAARAAQDLHASGRPSDPLAVATALGCRWVVSGSFQKMGASVRLTARVTEVATGRVAAAPKLDGTMDDLFSLQDKLSATLLSGIDRDAEPALSPAAPAQMKAYEWHARGRQELLRHGKSAFDQAIAHFEAAARADTTYAAPLSGLAAVYALRFTWTTDQSSLQIAAGYSRRSIELDPESGEPHVWLGYVLIRQRRFAEAIEAERRAIALSPRYVMGPYFAGVAAALGGDVAGGIPYFQQALELEPAHCWSLLGLGWCHLDTGHDEEALWCLRRAAELEARRQAEAGPTCGVAGYLGEALRRTGRLAEARAACMEALEAVERSDHMYRDTFRAVTLCALGRTALQQGDRDGARAAFHQAAGQLKGRTRTLGGGFLLVQALAGLTRAGEGEAAHDEASRILASRQGHDFSELWACTDGPTLLELSRSAAACGRDEDAARLQTEARAAGAVEPP